MNTADKLKFLTDNVEKARLDSPISAKRITILAASKTQPAEALETAIKAGVTNFGENKVQEAQEKWSQLKQKYPHICLHFIGHLQTNKVKQALELFDVIQTIDRDSLAEAISEELKAQKNEQTRHSTLKTHGFYIQVNTGNEPQKGGIIPENADEFIAFCRKLNLPITGLMCIPPEGQPPAPHFALLRRIALRNNINELSMGMSGDFEEAVRMGSTCVRIGSALFGERA